MNHVYRLVWSKVRNMLVAVAETAGSHSKGGTPRAPRHLRALLALLLILGAPLAAAQVPLGQGQLVVAAPVQAALAPVRTALVSVQRVDPGVSTPTVVAPLPTAGHVVAGQATLSQSGNTLTIAQSTSKAVLNWQSFDIGAGYTVNFEQPNASSVALNRVLGSNPSAIFGHLNANGQVFLTNANGVFFAPGAEVHVGGLVASTLGISNTDFLSGNYHFSGTSTAGVHNAGAMTAAQGGYVAFIGNTVDNTGTVRTPGGTTALGAGAGVDITLAGDQLVNFRVSDAALHALAANGGVIQADGGRVILSAQGRNAVLQTVVNNSGQIRAQTLENHDGKIELLGGDSGTVQVAGTLDASAPQGGNGGQIETSGASVKIADGTVITTKSSTGNSGNWLIDPTDFTIAASGGDMSGATLSTALGSGGVTIQSTAGGSGVHGDVNVNDTVTWSANTLTLNAYRDININTAMNGSGTAGLALQYGQGSTNGVIGGTAATYNVNAPVNLANGGSFSTQLGTNVGNLVSYTILTSLGAESSTTGTDLQGISGDLAGNYVLGSNIDALPTSGWNGGAGFAPIGSNNFNAYTGIFDGLGHTISDLTIARSGTDNVGLFGYVNGGTLRNLGLVGGSVSGYNKVGGLVGFNSNGGTITDAYVTGSVSVSVSGHYYVGGLVGFNNNGTITDAYVTSSSSVSVSGSLNVGGLVGYNGGTLSDAYATGRVSGSGGNVGGLVGFNSNGTISDAYATGSVSGSGRNVGGLIGQIGNGNISNVYATGRVSGSSGHVGGLVGSNSNGTINNAYWDSYSTGQAAALGAGSNFAATAITSDPTKSSNSNYAFKQSAYANFNFTTGTGTGTWFMVDGSTRPFLASEYSTTISNTHQLQLVAMDLGASYTLASNLDASETARAVNSSVAADASGMWSKAGFVPIGTNGNGFTGVFDGLGHTVSNLTINRPSTDFVGLFGHVNGGTLRDIGLVSDSITGNDRVGGLVGNNSNGSISDAYATGSVSGGGHVGGLIGFNYGGTISGAYTTGDVSGGDEYVGGLIGFNFGGTINNTYTSGSVSGTRYVGGLLGSNYQGMINNAYTSGSVNGSSFRIGGLVGYNVEGTIENAYTTGNVSGSANVGGLAGGNNAGTISNAYATGSATGNNSVVGRLVGSNSNGAIINNAYWDTTTSASGATVGIGYDNLGSISGGGGLTTAALAAALPTGFASGVWGNGDNQTTPYLLSHASFGTVSGSAILGTDSSATPTHYGVILTLDQLQNINSTGLSSDYVLGGNIDASATSGWNSGAGFAPIGNSNNAFNGVFDGLGHTVSGLIINRPSTDDVGLFGHVNGGMLRNIGLVDGSVSGKNFVGGLVGIIFTGTISDSYTTGSVSGDSVVGGLAGNTSNTTIHDSHTTGSVSGGAATGGLVGHNSNGSIGNVYATGSVSGSSNVGGLIGEHFYGTISDAYATGNVSSSAGNNIGGLVGYNGPGPINNAYATGSVSGNGNVGGLVGSNSNGTITNGYWDTNTATAAGLQGVGNSNNPNVIGLSTSALASALPAGFTTGVWGNIDNQTTPYLLANASFGTVSGSVILGTDSSTTPTYYNVILSLNQLQNINSTGLALDYVLGGNIDASATSGWNSGAGFAPLGADSNHSFTGVFDGLGHTVSGLTIDRSGTNNVGLFGYVDGGILRNIGLLGDSVSGRYNVGGLVGYNHGGTIIDAYATGGVNGGQFVGGLVGYNTATGTISDAYATGNISGFKFIGGLVGSNSNGMISDAYATGSVSGSSYIGGLAGYNSNNSTIRDSYATGSVSGIHSATGGLVGKNTHSTIINAYATGSVSGNSNAGGLVGSNSHGTISNAYATGSVSGNSNIGALVGINSNGTINNGYWDTSTSGQPTMVGASNSGTIAGGGGLDTTHIMQQGSFSNFDFSNVWIIYGDHTAPLLRYFMTPLIVTSDNQTKTYNGSSFALSTVSYSVAGAGSSGHLYGLGSSYNGAKDASATAYAPDLWSDQQGYIISYVGGALTINPLAVVLTGSRTYNGSNGIAGSALSASNLISGDSLSLTGSGTLASKNAGSEAITSFSGLTLSNSNYTLTGASGSVTINPLALTLTLPDVTKTYDGTTGYTLSSTDLAGLSGELLSGDTVTGATVTYADKNAGIGNKTVTFSGVGISDGNGGGNYLLTLAGNTTSTIDQKALTVAGLTGTDKTYDGTTNDPLSGTAMFNGLIGTQTLTVAGTLASANASNQGVALMLMLSDGSNGGVASNYTLTQPTLAPVTIAQASLTVTGLTGTDKTYDGSTLDPLSGTAMLNGLVGTQTLTLGNDSTGTLASANAGSQGVTTALTLSDGDNGGLASNYALTQPTLANVTVYPGQAGPDVVPNTESGIGSAEKLMQGGYIVPVSGPSIWLNPMATYDLRAGFGKPTQVDLTVCTAVTSTPHLACNRTYHLDPFAVSAIIVGDPSLPQQPRGM